MNQKEIGELRRRFRPEKNAISRIYGCYVNSRREVTAPWGRCPRRRPKNTWSC